MHATGTIILLILVFAHSPPLVGHHQAYILWVELVNRASAGVEVACVSTQYSLVFKLGWVYYK